MRGSENPEDQHRLIMVLSPKGGAGKTTISSNLAVGLALRAPKQVVLVDGDLQFGDVGNALRLLAETSIRDAIAGGLHDATEVKVHLTPHRSGGGHRRYSRRQLAVAARMRALFDEGLTLDAAARIVGLQDELDAARARIAELERRLAERADAG